MIYAAPGATGAKVIYKSQYDNFIGGKWVAPVKGQYFHVVTPISGKVYTFSLEGPEGKAFHTRSRVFTEAEMAELEVSDSER